VENAGSVNANLAICVGTRPRHSQIARQRSQHEPDQALARADPR
jgi:hypothetical protein